MTPFLFISIASAAWPSSEVSPLESISFIFIALASIPTPTVAAPCACRHAWRSLDDGCFGPGDLSYGCQDPACDGASSLWCMVTEDDCDEVSSSTSGPWAYCDSSTPVAAPNPCACNTSWTFPFSKAAECQVTQYGCQDPACDGVDLFCPVTDAKCDDVSPSVFDDAAAYMYCTASSPVGNALGNVVGDPHFLDGHGGRFDIRGRNNTWYVFLSTQNASVSLLINMDEYWWRKKVVYGSWLKGISVTATANHSTLYFLYHVDSLSIATKEKEIHAGEALEVGGVKVGLTIKHVFSFSNGAWEVEAKNRALPYKHLNGKKRRLDVTIRPIGDVDQDPVAPHGLLGQSYDRDDKMVIGALDNYDIPGKVVVTKAMGEGAIEGVAQDYEVDGPFSTSFKFSRFGASGPVPPRNVSSLSGLILPAKYGVAGATNDEVDA